VRDYQLGDMVRVRNKGTGVLLAIQAQPNSKGRTELRYSVQIPGEQELWVNASDLLGRVEAPRVPRGPKGPQRIRRRPSKQRNVV